jgi:hypothetical protein
MKAAQVTMANFINKYLVALETTLETDLPVITPIFALLQAVGLVFGLFVDGPDFILGTAEFDSRCTRR